MMRVKSESTKKFWICNDNEIDNQEIIYVYDLNIDEKQSHHSYEHGNFHETLTQVIVYTHIHAHVINIDGEMMCGKQWVMPLLLKVT